MKKVKISLEHTKKNWITLRMIGRASLTSTGARMQPRVRGQSLKMPATKYIYTKSNTVFVPSSELGRLHLLSRKRVCPPWNQRGKGTHSPAREGVRESSQFGRL